MSEKTTLGLIGGTGALGFGLAKRWLSAGYEVIIGSRSVERGGDSVEALKQAIPGANVSCMDYLSAAEKAQTIIVVVPFSSHLETLELIREAAQGKVVIDAVVPLVPPKVSTVQMPKEGSASIIAQAVLGEGAFVVGAFHNVAASKLQAEGPIDCDVLVCGNHQPARERVLELVNDLGLRGIDVGVLQNSIAAEAMTSLLIGINRRYKSDAAGIRITGLSL
jgi:NADPH-dependent F420 reductase